MDVAGKYRLLTVRKHRTMQGLLEFWIVNRLKLKPVTPGPAGTSTSSGCHDVKHRKWEPEGVHGELEGCNGNLQPKAAVAKVYTHGKGVVVPAVRLLACRVLVGPIIASLHWKLQPEPRCRTRRTPRQ